jgi:hypothetical protein
MMPLGIEDTLNRIKEIRKFASDKKNEIGTHIENDYGYG